MCHGPDLLLCVQVLRLLIELYEGVPNPDFDVVCQCLMFLDDAPEVARILERLLRGSEASFLARGFPCRCHRGACQPT